MANSQETEQLEGLIDRAFRDHSVQQAIESAGVNEPQLRAFLRSQADEIWPAAAKETVEFKELARDVERLRSRRDESRHGRPLVVVAVEIVLPIIAVILVVALFSLLSAAVRSQVSIFFSTNVSPHWFRYGTILAVVTVVITLLYRRQAPAYRSSLSRSQAALDARVEALDNAKINLERALIANGIRPAVVEYLNKLTPVFSLTLSEADTSGLAEVLNTEYEISTPARKQVIDLMNEMRAGSIGIAGPRGAGKTTLLWTLCEEANANPQRLSLFTSAPVQYEPRDFLLHLFTSMCLSVLQKETGLADQHQVWLELESLRESGSNLRDRVFGRRVEPEPEPDFKNVDPQKREFVKETRRTLRGLRFQQNYSAGWSGALKFRVAETGLNTAVQLAERQLSFPEVVQEFRRYLTKVTAKYERVVIAIDELDKLESDETAQKFVNGIKAIFGQPKVFYLISISENAMNAFERRGLPLRDVFDSSFDDVVQVDFLDFGASKRLISRRLYPAPSAPYTAFCHALSGGLPRDVIRQCRRIFEFMRANPDHNDFQQISRTLLIRDVRAKLIAGRSSVQKIAAESDVRKILDLTAAPPTRLEDFVAAIEMLSNDRHATFDRATPDRGIKDSPRRPAASVQILTGIYEEYIAYLYLTATMWELFNPSDELEWKEIESTGAVDSLASARQWMSVDARSAIRTINNVRKKSQPPLRSIVSD